MSGLKSNGVNKHSTIQEPERHIDLSKIDLEKLKEKYSPSKRMAPPLRGPSESSVNLYRVFASPPRRRSPGKRDMDIPFKREENVFRKEDAPIMEVQSTTSSERKHNINDSNARKSNYFERVSPVRTSGSPLRRRHIREIEDRARGTQRESLELSYSSIKKADPAEHEDEQEHKAKKHRVSFNNEVAYNDTLTVAELNDTDRGHLKNERSYGTEKFECEMKQILQMLQEVKERLQKVEKNQENLLRISERVEEPSDIRKEK